MENQADIKSGQENLEDDGYTTIHAPIKRHEGYNLTIGDFGTAILNTVNGFNRVLARAVQLESKLAEADRKLNHLQSFTGVNISGYDHSYSFSGWELCDEMSDAKTKLKTAKYALIDARSWFNEDDHPGAIKGIDEALKKISEGV